jgi:hypothetical protein
LEKIAGLEKVSGYESAIPLLAKLIYITGKENPFKKLFTTFEAQVIKHYSEFSPSHLDKFLKDLNSQPPTNGPDKSGADGEAENGGNHDHD